MASRQSYGGKVSVAAQKLFIFCQDERFFMNFDFVVLIDGSDAVECLP
jgi:hypothetical protein